MELKNSNPVYNPQKGCYQVVVDGRTEEGDIEYVISEYIYDGLFYRFSMGAEQDHEHSFSGVLRSLLWNPLEFSIAGFEEDYSTQQIRMLDKAKARLSEHTGDLPTGDSFL
ncbi:hypothetical protein [Enterocloster lavalensis]|uniref:hypothetical protein n=1 Tax=Enterocloster lavalensis TaxID=460384 RepID=UPI0023F0B02F|nr:hypothetical protein [Enterocloster lavalensis]